MFDFLIRAWFENKEKKTKSAFLHLKENQFKERVNDIRSFCSTCWDSEELKSIGKYFNCSRLYSVSANCNFSHHVRQMIKEKYEAFVSKCNAPMELLIDVYNSFYDDIWKNTDLDISKIYVSALDRISYDLYVDYDGNYKPDFNHYAHGWTKEGHVAYCVMADLMLLIRRCCDVIDCIRADPEYKGLYRAYSYYSITRCDKPYKEDNSQEVYEQAKKALEVEMNESSDEAKVRDVVKRLENLIAEI